MTQTEPAFDLRIRTMTVEADATLSLVLDDPAGTALPPWEPGAHIDVEIAPGLVRQYSLCGDPGDTSCYRIAVLRESTSRGGSAFVHERARPGDVVAVRGPRNNFPLAAGGRYILIAGGIGITPLLPMVHALDAAKADWQLHYAGRRRSSLAFLTDPVVAGARCSVVTNDAGERLDMNAVLADVDAEVRVYCCGPERLVAAVEELGQAWPQDVLHVERFRARQDAHEPTGEFTVECHRSGLEVPVAADESILTALRKAGVEVDSSCEEGVCGTCEVKVLEGDVDHRDSVLTEAEREGASSMMVCCSRASSERLVLDV